MGREVLCIISIAFLSMYEIYGLFHLEVCGDSIVATSLRVNDQGTLEGVQSFEVCASTSPPVQLCSLIERTHFTQITQCKVSARSNLSNLSVFIFMNFFMCLSSCSNVATSSEKLVTMDIDHI